MKPVNLEEHPELIEDAISEIEKRYPNYEPGCNLYQAKDWVLYKFKKILWSQESSLILSHASCY